MAENQDTKEKQPQVDFEFLQANRSFFQDSDDNPNKLQEVKAKIRELFNLKNVSFLFGSGTSNDAIPTMKDLFHQMKDLTDPTLQKELDKIKANSKESLEKCLEILYAARAYYQGILSDNNASEKKPDANKGPDYQQFQNYEKLINHLENYIYERINIDPSSDDASDVLELYKKFYQKIALRTKDNSRINVFTTNNDLFNETALDALNIHYINGFSGGLHKYFNPANFNYTLSKRMDTNMDKYEPVENLVYLYKLHGSVNWRSVENVTNNFFNIEEIPYSKPDPEKKNKENQEERVLIYPTPTKQEKSIGSPYVDLFREFQHKLLLPNSVLFIIGYSFSDPHVNDIIYRALATNSTITIFIFGKRPNEEIRNCKPIFKVEDPRIYCLYQSDNNSDSTTTKTNSSQADKPAQGAASSVTEAKPESQNDIGEEAGQSSDNQGQKNNKNSEDNTIHHFEYIVKHLIPDLDNSRNEDKIITKFIEQFHQSVNSNKDDKNR